MTGKTTATTVSHAQVKRARSHARFRHFAGLLLKRGFLLIAALVAIFPIIWLLLMSLKTPVDATAFPPKFLFRPTLDNYAMVFARTDFLLFFRNSIIVATCSTLLALLFGVPAAYALSRFRFKGANTLGLWILITYMFPPVASLIPFFLFFSKVHLINTFIAVVVMHVTIIVALITWMMRGFFEDVPAELEDAAYVDGCNGITALIRVILPVVLTGVVATGILAFLTSWNELLFAITVAGGAVKTAPAGIYNFISYREILWGPLAASSMLILVPVIVFFWFAQDKLIRGLAFGAVK